MIVLKEKDMHELEKILLSKFRDLSSRDIDLIMQYDGDTITGINSIDEECGGICYDKERIYSNR